MRRLGDSGMVLVDIIVKTLGRQLWAWRKT
jgi:hypothetical protein